MVYFATQARRQELADKALADGERLGLRLRVIEGNKQLSGAAKAAGVVRHALFQDAGIQGLYERSVSELKTHKGLGPKDELLDHAGELELAANDSRIQPTKHRLNRNHVTNEADAIHTHKQVGREVRSSVVRENGIKPEDLPVEKSIKPLVQKHKRD